MNTSIRKKNENCFDILNIGLMVYNTILTRRQREITYGINKGDGGGRIRGKTGPEEITK